MLFQNNTSMISICFNAFVFFAARRGDSLATNVI